MPDVKRKKENQHTKTSKEDSALRETTANVNGEKGQQKRGVKKRGESKHSLCVLFTSSFSSKLSTPSFDKYIVVFEDIIVITF
jgi:hypothetical protein